MQESSGFQEENWARQLAEYSPEILVWFGLPRGLTAQGHTLPSSPCFCLGVHHNVWSL